MGSAPSELSMVRVTSARPSGGRSAVPAKMTSSIFPPRSALAPCSPRTQAMASTTFDLPEPLGPTTQVMPGSRRSVVAEAKDLKPLTVRLLRCTDLRGSATDTWGAGYPSTASAARHAALARGVAQQIGQKDARRHGVEARCLSCVWVLEGGMKAAGRRPDE